ncbi:MAG: hypothetical protein HGA43_03295 [Nitrospirae bacterium]|nr:hypothetical protein [Nitrospirota bacterium]
MRIEDSLQLAAGNFNDVTPQTRRSTPLNREGAKDAKKRINSSIHVL